MVAEDEVSRNRARRASGQCARALHINLFLPLQLCADVGEDFIIPPRCGRVRFLLVIRFEH